MDQSLSRKSKTGAAASPAPARERGRARLTALRVRLRVGIVGLFLAVILPITLGYLGHAHWVFRGKTRADTGYGH